MSNNSASFETTAAAASEPGTGQWPLLDEVSGALDILYYGPAHFGTPSQTLTVDVDTGSADIWVPANCGKCHSHQFDAAHSSTFRPSNQDFSITYVGSFSFLFTSSFYFFLMKRKRAKKKGTGRVSGKVVTDVVSIAGLTVKNQGFGSVNDQSDEFSRQPNDGLIGMAFGTIAQSRQPTFFENLIKERGDKIAAPLFSVHLSRHKERGSSVRNNLLESSSWKARFFFHSD